MFFACTLWIAMMCADASGNWNAPGQTVLGIADTQFTINGQPTFLLGISYYGGLGAPEGWTMVIARTQRGCPVLDDAIGVNIEPYVYKDNPRWAFHAMAKLLEWSDKKKQHAALHHQELERNAG